MQINRRSLLRASGVTAVLGVTGLAGCSGLLGGGGGGGRTAANYQYDPATLLETENKFFGTMDYAQLYRARENLPESTRENFETNPDSPIRPEDITTATGVGGARISMGDSGSATVFGSFAVLGSFAKADLEESIQSQGEAQQSGTYEGFTLYENAGSTSTGGVGDIPSNTSVTAAVGEGTVIVGAASRQGEGTAGVSGRQAAEAMIDASNGNVQLLTATSQYAQQLTNRFAGSTFLVGGQVDPALVQLALSQATAASGMQRQMVQGIRAGGFGMTIDGQTTSMTIVAIYEDAQTAEGTGVVEIVNRFSGQAVQESPALDSVTANYEGNMVVVTLEGQTRAIFQQGSSVGGTGFALGPAAVPDA